jgi:hypothetical protein
MHLKVFLELKKPEKLSLLVKYINKTKKNKKKKKKTRKNPLGWFFLNPGFLQPWFKATLGEADKEFNAIISLIHDCENFARQYNVPGATINPYTNLTGENIDNRVAWLM